MFHPHSSGKLPRLSRVCFKGDIDIDIDVEVDVVVDIVRYFGCSKGVSKSVQVLFNGGISTVVILTWIIHSEIASPVEQGRD